MGEKKLCMLYSIVIYMMWECICATSPVTLTKKILPNRKYRLISMEKCQLNNFSSSFFISYPAFSTECCVISGERALSTSKETFRFTNELTKNRKIHSTHEQSKNNKILKTTIWNLPKLIGKKDKPKIHKKREKIN